MLLIGLNRKGLL